jgi:two-component system nitrogen regulation response regulator NtrX
VRRDDIPQLVRHFVDLFSRDNNFRPKRVTPAAMDVLQRYRWKGNIRELRNTLERLIVMTPNDTIDVADLPETVRNDAPPKPAAAAEATGEAPAKAGTLREHKELAERAFLVQRLRETGWNISKTAELIDTPRSNLYKKLEQYQISQETDG